VSWTQQQQQQHYQQQQQPDLHRAESSSRQRQSSHALQLQISSSSSRSGSGCWDSSWLLQSFSSIGGSSSSKAYNMLEQQQPYPKQQLSQQRQHQSVVVELSPLQPEHSAFQDQAGKPACSVPDRTPEQTAGGSCDDQNQQQDQHCWHQVHQQQQEHGKQQMQAGFATQQHEQEDSQSLPADSYKQQQQQQTPEVPWYKQRQVLLALAGYGNTCLLFCALDELTPMFASAPLAQGKPPAFHVKCVSMCWALCVFLCRNGRQLSCCFSHVVLAG
jgi:hypothetical protein